MPLGRSVSSCLTLSQMPSMGEPITWRRAMQLHTLQLPTQDCDLVTRLECLTILEPDIEGDELRAMMQATR
jgi:hypothetical protein